MIDTMAGAGAGAGAGAWAGLDALARLAALGGPVVAILAGLSVAVAAVAVYKLWQFAAAGVGRHGAIEAALAAWDRGEAGAARAHLARARSYLRPVLEMAITGPRDPGRLEAEAEARFARLERGFRLLDAVAQVAPLLGLFGTVLGMISAFRVLEDAGAQVDPSLLAGGIWVALLTTAAGLAVAMPAALALSWFEGRMDAERVLAGRALRVLLAPVRVAPPGQEAHARAGAGDA